MVYVNNENKAFLYLNCFLLLLYSDCLALLVSDYNCNLALEGFFKNSGGNIKLSPPKSVSYTFIFTVYNYVQHNFMF